MSYPNTPKHRNIKLGVSEGVTVLSKLFGQKEVLEISREKQRILEKRREYSRNNWINRKTLLTEKGNRGMITLLKVA